MRGWLRSLDPQLPRPVQMLQVGGLLNAFGNGIVLPFTLIYLHNVKGISLGVAGLVVGVLGAAGLAAGPVGGILVDRLGGRRILVAALVLLAMGYGSFALVERPWHALLAAAVGGAGNGLFWPAQSTLLATLTPPEKRPAAWGMQRVVMNLGVGLGAVTGGLLADVDRPGTFELLYVIDAATFVGFLAVVRAAVPDARPERVAGSARGTYRHVVRDRAFMAVIGLNTLLIFAGMAGIELLPVYAKNEAAVSETAIGLIFFVNTLVIVVAQLPITRLTAGYRRMRALALLALVWAACWVAVPPIGGVLSGASAAVLMGLVLAVFGIGECIHGAVQGPLVADLAAPQLLGRYMAVSALSWQVGFALGPAVGGAGLSWSPAGVWLVAAALCFSAGAVALAVERLLPAGVRRTPLPASA
jgi:MFS family permease